MGFEQPFNLDYWFINVFAGSQEIFIALAFMFFAGLAGKFRMPQSVMFIMLILFLIIAISIDSTITGVAYGIYILAIFGLSLGTYYLLAKMN